MYNLFCYAIVLRDPYYDKKKSLFFMQTFTLYTRAADPWGQLSVKWHP